MAKLQRFSHAESFPDNSSMSKGCEGSESLPCGRTERRQAALPYRRYNYRCFTDEEIKLEEIKYLTQEHRASEGKSWNVNPLNQHC